jgi:hypothetical protein
MSGVREPDDGAVPDDAARNDGKPTEEELAAERQARQRKRSIAIAVSLALLVLLFYIVTLVKMSDVMSGTAGS